MNDAPNLNFLWADAIVEELVRTGVRTFCISPGSRSAPLTLAVANHPKTNSIVHFDERASAFHALGHAKATGHPAVVICTSGTAVANVLPAVVEAALSCTPLLVLSADRPPELLDTGANQAIDQVNLFGKYPRWQHTLPCPDAHIPVSRVLTIVDQAVHRARSAPAGPVHLNCMFREPLTPEPEPYDAKAACSGLDRWRSDAQPYTDYATAILHADETMLQECIRILRATKRGLLVIGQLTDGAERDAARAIARALGWPVFADVTSGLRSESDKIPGVPYYDLMLSTAPGQERIKPDTVLHLGASVTSKRLNALLAQTDIRHSIRVAEHPFRHDPAGRVTLRLQSGLDTFADAIESTMDDTPISVEKEWLDTLRQSSTQIGERLIEYFLTHDTLSEIGSVRAVLKNLRGDHALFLGNSLPVRHADSFGGATQHSVPVIANRGASGIDGNIATATGYAAGAHTPLTAILGDLTALHDLNALALLRSSPVPVILIILNNDGGGIFSMLPVARHPEHFETHFGTPHGLSFDAIAAAFGLRYERPASLSELEVVYREACKRKDSTVIEITCDRSANVALHQELEEWIAQD